MPDFLTEWFHGLDEGINSLDEATKEKVFSSCGRKCVDTGIINLYVDLFNNAGRDLDIFFKRLNDLECVGGDVISTGRTYEISFHRCLCDLHTQGYMNSDCICECSRQSIIYVMKTIKPELEFRVDKVSTILSGDEECRFRISVLHEENTLNCQER